MMEGGSCEKVDPAVAAHLQEKFSSIGRRPNAEIDTIFRDSLRTIFSLAAQDVAIYVVLGSTRFVDKDGCERVSIPMRDFNAIVAELAGDFPNVELLAPLAFMTQPEIAAMTEPNHFDRIIYYRMFRHMAEKSAVRT